MSRAHSWHASRSVIGGVCLVLAAYYATGLALVGLPFGLMWRAYRQAAPSFVAPEDAVSVSWQPMDRTQRIALTLLVLLSLAAVLAIIHSCALAGASALR